MPLRWRRGDQARARGGGEARSHTPCEYTTSPHCYRISPGKLYPTLHRLEADGLLTSPRLVIDGRTRRLYRATDAGKAALAEDRATLAELAREVLGPQL